MSNLKPCRVLYLHTMKRYTFWHFNKLTGLNLKQVHELTGFYFQHRFFSSRVCWHTHLSKRSQKVRQHFGSVANRSTIHFSLKRLTKLAGSHKQSYHFKFFLKTGSFQCGVVDISYFIKGLFA